MSKETLIIENQVVTFELEDVCEPVTVTWIRDGVSRAHQLTKHPETGILAYCKLYAAVAGRKLESVSVETQYTRIVNSRLL